MLLSTSLEIQVPDYLQHGKVLDLY